VCPLSPVRIADPHVTLVTYVAITGKPHMYVTPVLFVRFTPPASARYHPIHPLGRPKRPEVVVVRIR
jgi:hypothetical protein